MSIYKRCSQDETLQDGRANPHWCATSPRCEHDWHYYFRIGRRRYRASAETADRRQAQNIEAKERARILEGRHGIRRQPDITFRQFAETYLADHAALHKRDGGTRDRLALARLHAIFGTLLLHEITTHRIEQWKRDRLHDRWTSHRQASRSQPVKPSTVNRELDVLKSVLSKAVEWGVLVDSPARKVKRLRVENRRTRILSPDEEAALVAACQGRFRVLVALALVTGAPNERIADSPLGTGHGPRDRLPGDQERPTTAVAALTFDGRPAGHLAARLAVGLREPANRGALQERREQPRSGARARRHHDRRRDVPYAAPYGSEPHDCARAQRSHRDGD
jgi:hypothetical protein